MSAKRKNRIGWLGFVIVVLGLLLGMIFIWQQDFGKEPYTEQTQVEGEPENPGTESVDDSLVTGSEAETESGVIESTEPVSEEELLNAEIQQILDTWSLKEKVAQLFFVTPEAIEDSTTVVEVSDSMRTAYVDYPVGGIICMKKNLTGPDQTRELLQSFQRLSRETLGVPIFLGVDEEGGTVARIAGQTVFGVENVGNMSAIGATGDTGKAYAAGITVGTYLYDLGFTVDFAPVVDVWTNPENKLMEKRSFGSDASLVGDMAISFARGLEEQGVWACAKHFPGHGDTKEDSHEGFAFTDKTLEELRRVELVPFAKQIEEGVSFIMAGHISVPNILEDSCPSSLSKVMITDVLREEMGFDGIVITDALNMGAIANHYTSGEAAVMALQAGVDILLMPKDFPGAYDAVLKAVESGELSEERLEESLVRILKVKLGE
ncbi:MAG: glycoside hydrolase family 3 protein [Lachnospiraceae bacterium]|nr:glycoside hydrolase family 3 protein [Lachnospiraceae bacterium]